MEIDIRSRRDKKMNRKLLKNKNKLIRENWGKKLRDKMDTILKHEQNKNKLKIIVKKESA